MPVKIKNTRGADNKQKPLIEKQITDVAKQQEIKSAPGNNLPKPSLENFNKVPGNNNDVATVSASDNSSKGNDVVQPADKIPANEIAILTTYPETETINPGDDEDNKNRKSKIGGFFKKLKRVVERKTNMKSGDNSFRIANMSFAVQ